MNDSAKTFLNEYGRWIGIAAAAALAMLALFLLVKTFDAIDRFGKSPYAGPNVITVTGTGKAATPPTIAEVVFTVQETAGTVEAAQEAATARTNSALDAIQALDIANEDIQTSGYNVYPQYENPQPCFPGTICAQGSPNIIGYQVSQTITVTIRDVAKAGNVLAALGEAGVQNISGPDFRVDDDSEVLAEARGKAIDDAREKAEELAKQLGVDLGDVVSFSENGGPYPMYNSFDAKGGVAMEAASMAPRLPIGESESTVTVSVTYEID